MSPLPNLPGGVDELPAARFVMFADGNHLVQRVDEGALTLNGVSFTGVWETGSLNKGELVEKTLTLLTLFYQSPVDTTLTIRVSGDGGETWNETKAVNILTTAADRIRKIRQGFETTGLDVRIRLELDTDQVFYLLELHPVLVRRGEHEAS